ncbi:hypothetical protein RB195_001682 [Necator americanus]
MTKIIRSISIDGRMLDSWRHAIIIFLHKKLTVTEPKNYLGISLLRVMHRVLKRKREQAGFRPRRSTIDQVFIVKTVIEIWQRYSKPIQIAFLDFGATFDSPHRGRLLDVLRAEYQESGNWSKTRGSGITLPVQFRHRRHYAKKSRSVSCRYHSSTIRTPQDLDYATDIVIFAESSTKLQHVVNLVSKLPVAYGLRLRPDKCEQMWISSRPRTGTIVDGQPIELVDEFGYLGCTLKNIGSYEKDIQQRCGKAIPASNSLTKFLWSTTSPTKSTCESTYPQFAPS